MPSHQPRRHGLREPSLATAWKVEHLALPIHCGRREGQLGLEGGHCTDGETEAWGEEEMPRRYGGQASPQSTSSLRCEGM